MKKKILKTLIALNTAIVCINPVILMAEGNPCDTDANSEACSAYKQQQALQSSSSSAAAQKAESEKQLAEIKAKRAEIAANIAQYKDEIAQYQTEIDGLSAQIDTLNTRIAEKQVEIDDTQAKAEAKQVEINDTQDQINQLSEKVKTRMSTSQSGMRINKIFSILMGASTFTDFIRIINGLNDISEYDNETTNQLVTLSQQLKQDKQELDDLTTSLQTQQNELAQDQTDLADQKDLISIKQEQIQVFKDAAEDTAAELEAQGEKISSTVDTLKATINSNAAQIDALQEIIDNANKPTTNPDTDSGSGDSSSGGSSGSFGSSGWVNPVPGAYRSAGTWNYPGGGKHLGYDFAASQGTTIRAVGDGVVIVSADGATEGYLGSTAHGAGGSSGGGNQIYLLTVVNGSLYAVKYLHMQYGSPIALGTQVKAGDYIGKVGATGNVTGPHCHIEIFYLGDASNFSNYLRTWNGDLAFGCGWAGSYGGYGRRCQDGYGAPCRVRPESYIG